MAPTKEMTDSNASLKKMKQQIDDASSDEEDVSSTKPKKSSSKEKKERKEKKEKKPKKKRSSKKSKGLGLIKDDPTEALSNMTDGVIGNGGQQQQSDGSHPLSLRLDVNLEVEITLKARIHGDVTLALLA